MATIVLARHGKPVWDERTPIPGRALGEWARGRDEAPIDRSYLPPVELVRIAQSSRVLAVSPLRRSRESGDVVAPGLVPRVDRLFREVFLPTAIHSSLCLAPKVWSSLARLAWYGGWSPGVESFTAAGRRASLAASALVELAVVHESVLLVGHGILNGLIGHRLRRAGWSGPRFRIRRLWAFAVYQQLSIRSRIS